MENEIITNHLEPIAVESDILHFDPEYDDNSFENLKELSVSSRFYLFFQDYKNTNTSCLGPDADFSQGSDGKICLLRLC